jgi:FkbM family methyltransferase
MSARQLARRLMRRVALMPLQTIDATSRAEAIEILTARAITPAPLPQRTLKFYAPSVLLRQRAEGILAKEPDTIAWLDTLTDRDVLWDVGANVGVFTLYAVAMRGCRALAFEPSAPNFFVLTRNIQLNDLSDRATAYCVALSGASELGTLNLDSPSLGAALSQFGSAGDHSRYAISSKPVTHGMLGFTVDDFIRQFTPLFPTHIKLDVDGLEWRILQGAAATLRDARLRSLMVELSLTQTDERERAWAFLEGCGFRFVSRGASQGHAGEHAANHLFERR